jgi:hypothetical protein
VGSGQRLAPDQLQLVSRPEDLATDQSMHNSFAEKESKTASFPPLKKKLLKW